MTMTAARFALSSMLPSRCQLLISGPKIRCSRNQLSNRFEDRANAKAATNRNGVVGNRGRTTPTAPRPTAPRPTNNQMNRVFTLTRKVHHTSSGFGKYSNATTAVGKYDMGLFIGFLLLVNVPNILGAPMVERRQSAGSGYNFCY